MRFVILTNIPTPYRTAFFNELAAASDQLGAEFHVLYCAQTEPGRHWPYEPAKMRHPYALMGGLSPKFAGACFHINPSILNRIAEINPDTLLIAGSWNTPTMLMALLGTSPKTVRRLFWSEGHAKAVLHKHGPIAWLRRKIYSAFDGFAVPNSQSADWARVQSGSLKPVLDLPNSIDVSYFRNPSAQSRGEIRQKLGIPVGSRVLVQVSSLTHRKGVLDLAESFLRLSSADGTCAHMIFVGEGDCRKRLEALAAKSGGTIRVLGHLAPSELRQVLWASNAFFLNTRLDPNPLSPIEASAAGLPVVMSRAAGNVREMIEAPAAGFVIEDPSDPSEALAYAMSLPEEKLKELGSRAASNASRFDAAHVARALISQLYPASRQ